MSINSHRMKFSARLAAKPFLVTMVSHFIKNHIRLTKLTEQLRPTMLMVIPSKATMIGIVPRRQVQEKQLKLALTAKKCLPPLTLFSSIHCLHTVSWAYCHKMQYPQSFHQHFRAKMVSANYLRQPLQDSQTLTSLTLQLTSLPWLRKHGVSRVPDGLVPVSTTSLVLSAVAAFQVEVL